MEIIIGLIYIYTQRDNRFYQTERRKRMCHVCIYRTYTTSAGGEANNNGDDGDCCSDALPITDAMNSSNGNITFTIIKIELKHKIILSHEKQN